MDNVKICNQKYFLIVATCNNEICNIIIGILAVFCEFCSSELQQKGKKSILHHFADEIADTDIQRCPV